MPYDEDGEYYEEAEYEIENVKKQESEKDTLELKCDLRNLKEQIVNEIKYKVKDMVITEIKKEVKEEIINQEFRELLKNSIQDLITQEAIKIFDEGMTVTDRWGDVIETRTFREIVKEQTKKELEKSNSYYSSNSYKDKFEDQIKKTIKNEIENEMKSITDNVKSDIQEIFNNATKDQLSETMFNLLMQNETYQKLNNSIKLLGK